MIIKENSIYCYLLSMAYMEAAVSKLLDAQAEEIRIISESGLTIEQITEFNENMQKNLNSLTKLHLIHLMKFDMFMSFLSVQNTHEEIGSKTESHGISEKQTNRQQPEVQIKQPIVNEYEPPTYVIKGRGQGNVCNRSNPFCNGLAIFQVCLSNLAYEKKESFFCYSVMKGTKMLVLLAAPESVKTEFILKPEYKTISATGTGMISMKERSKADIKQKGCFVFNLRVENTTDEPVTFVMSIQAVGNEDFNHESGQIESKASRVAIDTM